PTNSATPSEMDAAASPAIIRSFDAETAIELLYPCSEQRPQIRCCPEELAIPAPASVDGSRQTRPSARAAAIELSDQVRGVKNPAGISGCQALEVIGRREGD